MFQCGTAELWRTVRTAVLVHFTSSSSGLILGANLESNFAKLEPYLNPEWLF